mmetsp:Transcript_71816/g.126832  ORF Transcript_71816/g.126832 Transcript_71816/m.126832 type:complete len:505 (+) Transcript_71816:22-1536(+)
MRATLTRLSVTARCHIQKRCCGRVPAPEFEYAGDKAEQTHLPRAQQGGFARCNFVKATNSSKLKDAYDIAGSVGAGAFGSVCAGRCRKMGHDVAVKTIPKYSVQDADALQREIEFMRLTDHPNVARLYEVFEDEDDLHLVMELCSGGELWKRILSAHEAGLGFSEAELADATRQMLRAVAYCHSQSIVHRDIKPENFLFASKAPDSPLKLVDFGIGGVVPGERPETRFLTAMVGTDGYMAPEILLSKPYGPAADLFSVGAVMHAAIVGLPPRWAADKAAYDFPGRMRWRMLSKDAQHLLASVLQADPCARPTAVEALQHPWLSSSRREGSQFDSEEILNRLKSFGRRSKLERAARFALVALNKLRGEEVQQLQEAFLEADADGSGEVTEAELLAVLQRKGSQELPEQLFQHLDSSGEGQISYTEFLAAAASNAWVGDSKGAREAFDSLDADGDGFISPEEIDAALPGVYTPEELAQEIERLDQDGDGNLNFEEFCRILQEPVDP